MQIAKEPFGVHEGAAVHGYTLRNENGCVARLIDLGARLVGMHVPDRAGRSADIVLGFDDVDSYAATDLYLGATCGRYANRIRKGRLVLGGTAVEVTRNENGNHLHGGRRGFDKAIWSAYADAARNAVTFTHFSPDGDEGFPGGFLVKAEYRLTHDNELHITMAGLCDAPTVVNLANHAYWNCAGHGSGDIRGQLLQVEADFYTPVDGERLATGEIAAVEGTLFDFRAERPIGRAFEAGYDHNWVVRGAAPELRPVATMRDPASGRGFALSASEPGVQIYTGGALTSAMAGKGGVAYRAFAGLALETQKFPDSPGFGHFPSARLDPGQVYRHRMVYRFFAR